MLKIKQNNHELWFWLINKLKIYLACLLKTKNLNTFESNFKIFEKLVIYFGILEKFN